MPKEKIKLDKTDSVSVGWSKEHNYVEVGVDIGVPLIIIDTLKPGSQHIVGTDLWVAFQTEKDFDKFLKVLKRAGKQAFKS